MWRAKELAAARLYSVIKLYPIIFILHRFNIKSDYKYGKTIYNRMEYVIQKGQGLLMKKRGWRCLAAAAAAASFLCACGDGAQNNDSRTEEELKVLGQIQPVTREAGSGTRSSFAQILGINEDGVDDKDYITDTAQEEVSGDDVIKAVGAGKGTIGYVTYGTDISRNKDVKEVSVDGMEAEKDTIENGEYPLSRTLYLASPDDGNALKEDFLTYITGKGQEIVADFFVPAAKSKDVFLSNQTAGTLRIHGSTSLAPVMETLAEQYEEANPNADIEVTASDSSQGITDTLTGACEMAMVSRDLYKYEENVLQAVPVAKDGIRIIVQADNPVKNLSMKTLTDIFSGKITEWAETTEK